MAKTAAPSARAMLSQASRAWPARRTSADGIVPSAAHTAANPTSDHEPGAAGYCHAVDLTHDPGHGCDCGRISEALRAARDERVKYVIFNRRMFSRPEWTWRAYSGTSPHTEHMHVSILDTRTACEDVHPWPGIIGSAPVPSPAEEDDVVITLITPPIETWHRFWRLRSAQGDYLYTPHPAEVQSVVNAGYVYEGIGFDVSLTDPSNINDLYRLVKSGWHHYCLKAEADSLKAQGWTVEGAVAKVGSGGRQVVRLSFGPAHLFTASEAEVASAMSSGWKREGVAFGCGVAVEHICDATAAAKLKAIDTIIHT